MTSNALRTLLHPFETGALPHAGKGSRVLFLGAEPGFGLPDGFDAALHMVQGFRPSFRALELAGHEIAPQAEGDGFDAALVLVGRHRGQNELRVAEALERTLSGGLIVVAGGKDDGIASLRKSIVDLVSLDGSLPKHHGIAFWLRQPGDIQAATALRTSNPNALIEGRFRTAPGMFSFEKIDEGSRFLVAHLPGDLRGDVADFCAGWGYLSADLVDRYPDISRLDLYEADFQSLEAARVNVGGASVQLGFHWLDLLAEPLQHQYDAIVMNPPFHRGRAAEPDIGSGMIRAAARALRPGGRLVMVANRQLPYETALAAAFSRHTELARNGGFKVLMARR